MACQPKQKRAGLAVRHPVGVSRLFDVSRLPTPDCLRARHLALLLIDEGLGGPARFYWLDDAPNGPLAHSESGLGDHYFARFWDDGALLWGFWRESALRPEAHPDEPEEWPGLMTGLPESATAVLEGEPDEIYRKAVTFCFWSDEASWHSTEPEQPDWEPGDEVDLQGAEYVLEDVLSASAAADHVNSYHERPELRPAAAALIAAVESGQAVATAALNPFAVAVSLADLTTRAASLGIRVAA
jgi:hypothetical protein